MTVLSDDLARTAGRLNSPVIVVGGIITSVGVALGRGRGTKIQPSMDHITIRQGEA